MQTVSNRGTTPTRHLVIHADSPMEDIESAVLAHALRVTGETTGSLYGYTLRSTDTPRVWAVQLHTD